MVGWHPARVRAVGVGPGGLWRVSSPDFARPGPSRDASRVGLGAMMPWSWLLVSAGSLVVYLGGLVYLGWLMRRDDGG